MKEIVLTKGKAAIVDDDMFEELLQYNWYAAFNKQRNRWVAERREKDSNGIWHTILMHRIITNAESGVLVDHQDHNTLNNKKDNLRLCTYSQNAANHRKSKANTSGFIGVRRYRNDKFVAVIMVNFKSIYLGIHDTAEAAAYIYDEAAIRYFGSFATTNKSLGLLI